MSVKKFVLLAALALVATMAIGATTASATIVTCGAGVHCPSGQTFNGHATGMTIITANGDFTCGTSYMKGKLTSFSTGGGTVAAQITDVHFGSCTYHNATCTIASTNAALGVSYNATFTGTSLTVSSWSVPLSLTCFGQPVTCTYSHPSLSGSISGSNVTYDSAVSLTGGFACAVNATLRVTYALRTGTTVGSGTLMTVDA